MPEYTVSNAVYDKILSMFQKHKALEILVETTLNSAKSITYLPS